VRLSDKQITAFNETVWSHYNRQARHELPWRQAEQNGSFDPYKIWVSELMLQQTQVNRVTPKYLQFMQRFPDVSSLASAELGEVLIVWQGLGYNRRAKYLWQAAQLIMQKYKGVFPDSIDLLITLPGVGHNTAAAIMAYAFNRPELFVETNVRSVYFHHFFTDQHTVSDKEIVGLLEQTLDTSNPREYYWALMDYGTYLKRRGHAAISRSKHYVKQSKFEGSLRQVRGRIIKLLAQQPFEPAALLGTLDDARAQTVLTDLEKEELIRLQDGQYRLA
jgi:A/G-specific adenine glycosylase